MRDPDKTIPSAKIYQELSAALACAGREVPDDIYTAITSAHKTEEDPAKEVLAAILKNIDIAKETGLPLCQDTGMVLFYVKIGEGVTLVDTTGKGESLKSLLFRVVEDVYSDNYFRKSVVSDPLGDRPNTQNNLPPLINWELVTEPILEISFLLKGFGSENCSRIVMMKPTASREDVIEAVAEIVKEAGGSPCPPTVLGVGLGGTMDYAALLSKKALLRDIDCSHPEKKYSQLEVDMLERVNQLNIGPGGLGGKVSSLGLNIEYAPTHIAGLPLAVSVNCWADRKGHLSFVPQIVTEAPYVK